MFNSDDPFYAGVSRVILESLNRYGRERVETGQFLRAVLSNDLFGAVGRADPENLASLESICRYVYNELPMPCHGSREAVTAWLAKVTPSDYESNVQES